MHDVARASDAERPYLDALHRVLDAGAAVLAAGGGALAAVETAVALLEDEPLFNAGRGSVFTADGGIELDAAIMDGRTLAAGAVACVRTVRNPVRLARAILERSPHVLLAGDGAEAFAREQGIAPVDARYFWTARRWERFVAMKRDLGEDVAWPEGESTGYGRRGRARRRRASRGCDVDRWHDQQARRPRGRFPDHRCRNLRGRPDLRGVGYRNGGGDHACAGRARGDGAHAPLR